ncbi:MFS transporter [Microbacterium sp. YY-01]|uniref:MFS transporter n=1 Tax=Microbacterium sp. YY-01 TaxID=3421634 RepID=UPI003D164052
MTPHSFNSAGEPAPKLISIAGVPYFVIAFMARLPFAMMVVGVLTLAVTARGSIALGGLTSAAVGVGTALFGPLLGAAADRFGQRPVLVIAAVLNGTFLVLFCFVSYSALPDAALLLSAAAIGATAPQVAPMSRSRLVMMITEQMPKERHSRTIGSMMAYESAADETVFVFGPFIVGLLASFLSPWAPLVIGAVLTVIFVGAFALHPSGSHISADRDAAGQAPSSVRELFRARLMVVVVGMLAVGFFFGTMLTALTSFMDDRGAPEQAGLLYGVMGIGSAALALGVALLPARFSLRARWLVFSGILFGGTLLLPVVHSVPTMLAALAVMGIGIGPTLVTQFSFGAAHSPRGRSATVMTMLGSSIIVGQSAGAAAAGEVAGTWGTAPALLLPLAAGAVALLSGVVNALLNRPQTGIVAQSR